MGIIEMQVAKTKERAQYYAAKAYAGQASQIL